MSVVVPFVELLLLGEAAVHEMISLARGEQEAERVRRGDRTVRRASPEGDPHVRISRLTQAA